jgi:hypothetical protein
VLFAADGVVTTFKVKKSTKMKKIMDAYANRLSKEVRHGR